MPGQFILQYYVDNTAKKLKGSVDLDQCEQVDSGLTFECGKLRFQYMFDIRTPRRVYYLAADTEEEMSSWVDLVCRVCGLHNYSESPGDKDKEGRTARTSVRTPVTQQSEISGPYMHLSECFTGSGRDGQMRRPRLDTTELSGFGAENSSTLCGDDSVFLPASPASVKSVSQKMSSMSVSGAPGRPPKPDNLRHSQTPRAHGSNEIYENHEEFSKIAASTPLTNRSEDTKYESNNNCDVSSTNAVFYPPTVDRRLKPERSVAPAPLTTGPPVQRRRKPSLQLTGSGTWHGAQHGRASPGLVIPPGMSIPASPDIWDEASNGGSDTGSVCGGRVSSEEQIYFYMPSLGQQAATATDGSWNPIMIPASELHENAVEYLDLDLPPTDSSLVDVPGGGSNLIDRQHNLAKEKETVYKTVDFVKTEAFNRTRQKVEEYKYNIRQEN